MNTLRSRTAFTLIELLVVIAIIAVLMGLLLPAVQKVRSAADRITCQNNLKQIGLAMHNYHNDFGSFPPGYLNQVWPNDPSLPPGHFIWSAHAHILPYIEQGSLADLIDMSYPLFGGPTADPPYSIFPVNRDGVARPVVTFLCPADESNNVKPGYAPASYVTCAGSTPYSSSSNANGVYYVNSKTKITQVKDGTSNTVLASESLIGPGGAPFTTDPGDRTRVHVELSFQPISESLCSNTNLYGNERGYAWTDGSTASASYNHVLTPNSKTMDCYSAYSPNPGWRAARSNHGNGVNIVLADGSVRFVNANINAVTWSSLGTVKSGDVVGQY